MNKKFLSVVLFGALMAGSSVTFTGCIDNDEPAGIEELRGAKAELIRANAAYKQAEVEIRKVDIERQQILLEREKIDMEMQKLDLEIKQASSAKDIAFWEQEKALLVEQYKAKILEAQTNAANWEVNYLKALADLKIAQATVTDEAYAKKLGELISKIEGEQSNIMELNNQLFDLAQELLDFSSGQYEAIKATAESDLKNHESKLENMTAILEEVKTLQADFGTEAINAQIKELDVKIAKIDKQTAELRSKLIEVIGTATEPEQAYSKQEVLLETPNNNVTFAVPATIQEDFIGKFLAADVEDDYNGLSQIVGTSKWDGLLNEVIGSDGKTLKADINVTELQLGSVTSPDTVLTSSLLSAQVTELSDQVKIAGVRAYAEAYQTVSTKYGFGSLSAAVSSITELTADDLAKGKAALAQVEKDITLAQTTYTEDSTEFVAAVKAYQEDAEAYGIRLQLNDNQEDVVDEAWGAYMTAKGKLVEAENANPEIATAKEELETVNGKLVDAKKAYDEALEAADGDISQVDAALIKAVSAAEASVKKAKEEYDEAVKAIATETAAVASAYKTLQAKLVAYYPLRKNLIGDTDDFVATVAGVNEGKEFKFAEKIADLTEEQFASAIDRKPVNDVYGESYTSFNHNSDKTGSLIAWKKASVKLYGVNKVAEVYVYEQIIKDLSTVELLSSIVLNSQNASAKVLVTLTNAKDAFSNIDSWNALATTIEGIATATAKKEEPIVAEIKKQSAAIKAIYEPYRDTFYELCALDIDQYDTTGDGSTDIFESLKKALNITAEPNTEGEKQTLTKLKAALETRLEGSSNSVTISFPVYMDGKLVEDNTPVTSIMLTEEGIQEAIDKLEKNISYLGEYIGAKKDEIKKLEDGTLTIEDFIVREKEKIENEIAFKEEQIKNAQERFDALNKAKDALIAEFAGSAE